LGIWPNIELFRRLFYFKTQTLDLIPVTCVAASFYARKTAGFPKLSEKESCKKWQRSFYAKNLGTDVDHVNPSPFESGGPGDRNNWSTSLLGPGLDMALILKRIIALQGRGGGSESARPLACLHQCSRVAPAAPVAQDVLPGV
jgi:hypothetical protein